MAFVWYHIKDIKSGLKEYDDQLSIKLKKFSESEAKKKLKGVWFRERTVD